MKLSYLIVNDSEGTLQSFDLSDNPVVLARLGNDRYFVNVSGTEEGFIEVSQTEYCRSLQNRFVRRRSTGHGEW